MYLSYANFTINKSDTKRKNIINLADVYKETVSNNFPIKKGALKLLKIEACSNNKGCNPKQQDGSRADFMIGMKDDKSEVRNKNLFNDDTKYVVIFVKCSFKLGNTEANLSLRIQKSGVVGARIGLSTQDKITMTSRDNILISLKKEITQSVLTMFPSIPKLSETSISAVSVQGYNLFNPRTGQRPEKRIKNFISTLRLMDTYMLSHELDYNQRNGKQIVKGNFKPNDKPLITIGVTPWGMVDFLGNGKISEFVKSAEQIQETFNKASDQIVFNRNSKAPQSIKKTDKKGGCPKSLPAVNSNGRCPNGRVPIPNKNKSLCCYKMKITKTSSMNIIEKYAMANMNIPSHIKSQLSSFSSIKIKKPPGIPKVDNNTNDIIYKGKPFRCMYLQMNELKRIATLMNINPQGFKKDLCERILNKLNST